MKYWDIRLLETDFGDDVLTLELEGVSIEVSLGTMMDFLIESGTLDKYMERFEEEE